MTAPDPEMVLVRRDDLREVIERHEDSEAYAIIRLRAVVNGEATTVGPTWSNPSAPVLDATFAVLATEYRVVDATGEHVNRDPSTWDSAPPAERYRDRRDEVWPQGAPHRVEQRTRASVVGPWTTQETP